MGDRTYVNLQIFGPVPAAVLDAIAAALANALGERADEAADALRQYHGQAYAVFEDSECYTTDFDPGLAVMRQHNIPYRLDWDGHQGEAGCIVWAPGLGEGVEFPTSAGKIAVRVEGNIAFERDLDTARDAISRLLDYDRFTVVPTRSKDDPEPALSLVTPDEVMAFADRIDGDRPLVLSPDEATDLRDFLRGVANAWAD